MVLSVGPGRSLPLGARYPMQAEVLDRILFEEHDYYPIDATHGFVRDEALIALAPFEDEQYGCWQPASGFALVLQDARPETLISEGGIAVATHALEGGEKRSGERGEQLFRELQTLERRWAADGIPESERRSRVWREYWTYGGADREALALAAGGSEDERGHWRWLYTQSSFVPPSRGTLLAAGPGDVGRDGVRRLPIGRELKPGDTVWWSTAHTPRGEVILPPPIVDLPGIGTLVHTSELDAVEV